MTTILVIFLYPGRPSQLAAGESKCALHISYAASRFEFQIDISVADILFHVFWHRAYNFTGLFRPDHGLQAVLH